MGDFFSLLLSEIHGAKRFIDGRVIKNGFPGDLLGDPVAKTLYSQYMGAWVQSLVREPDPISHN